MKTGGTGTATVQSNLVKNGSYAAKLTSDATTGSYAYARKSLSSALVDVTVASDFQITTEGAKNGNVPLFRLYDAAGTRLVSLYRANQSGDKLWLQYGGFNYSTSGTLALNRWGRLQLRVVTAGNGSSSVEAYLDGVLIYTTTSASLGSSGILTLQIGNETTKQTFALVADNIQIRQ